MSKIERFNSSADLYNATAHYFYYLIGKEQNIDKSIMKKTELALLSTYLLSLKEEIIIIQGGFL